MGDSRDCSSKRFTGDRYERLRQGAHVLAQDPALADAAFPFNGDGLPCFVAAIAAQRIFDRLSERDADIVTMLLLLDYHRGPPQLSARIYELLSSSAVPSPCGRDMHGVVIGLAAALALMTNTRDWALKANV